MRTSSLAALLSAVPLALAGTMPASAATLDETIITTSVSAYEPQDRGMGDRDRGTRDRDRGQAEEPGATDPAEEETPPDPCPTEMWTIPVEVEGLLCVMALPKAEEPPAEEPAPAPVSR